MNIELPIDLHVVFYCKFFKEIIMVCGITDTTLLATVAYTDGSATKYRLTLLEEEDFGDYICDSVLYRKFTISAEAEDHKTFGGAYKFLIADSGKLEYVEVFPPANKLGSFKVFVATEEK